MERLKGIALALALLPACESRLPPVPDFSGQITYDLGPPLDLPAPWGLDGNFLPAPDPHGTLHLSVTDSADGLPLPSRVIFRPPPGSGFADSITMPLPKPMDDHRMGGATGATVSPGVVGSPEGVLLQSGWGQVELPPGTYKVVVTRGPSYELAEAEVRVEAGVDHALNVALTRSVDTRGWLAADMHIHSGLSFDSHVPVDRRVISMVTNGIEIMVPTEHHGSYDFAEMLPLLGYGPEVAGTVAGNELNFKEGHAGVYPVPTDPSVYRGGSPPYQALAPDGKCAEPRLGTNCYTALEAFPIMHAVRPGNIVTINHPWFGTTDLGYFTNIGWGAGTGGSFPSPLVTEGSFDAIEIINGYWTESHAEAYLLADWFYLLSRGLRVAALGNSDTHRINWVRAGWPRTWLRLPIDHPGDITGDMLADAIRNQRAIASTGPFLTLEVEHGQIGDTVRPATPGQVRVHIVADAPEWISVDEVILFVNGRERRRFDTSSLHRPRLDVSTVETVSGDSFLVVLATGRTPLPADIVGEYSELNGYRMYPWAVTNPIYVDADGDGRVDLRARTSAELPWAPPMMTQLPPLQPMSAPPDGSGAVGPAGRDCEPHRAVTEHVPLDALSDLMHDAAPLLYP